MLIHHFLEQSATRFPDKVALTNNRETITYSRLNQSADRLASWFVASEMQRGDRAVLLLENGTEYVTAYYAVLKTGMVAVPISPDIRSDALLQILTSVSPRVVIASSKGEKTLHSISLPPSVETAIVITPRLSWNHHPLPVIPFHDACAGQTVTSRSAFPDSSLSSIIFTSGSSGKPKGVMLTHANIVSNTHAIVQYLGLTESDRQMVVLPFFYVMGKSLLNTHVAVGGSLVINNTFAYPAAVLQQMAEQEVTGFSGVPSTYAYLLHRSPLKSYRDKLPRLRYCSQAGGHMPRQIKEELLATLPDHTRLYVMYGATEAAARLTYVEPERLREKIDSIGVPIPGVTLQIMDKNGTPLPRGAQGEIVASGPNIMSGYWNDPEGSAAALCSHGYRTGDIGYQDEDGYFYIVGRKDSQLKSGGHRINPQEIEDALIATQLVIEAAVIGIDDALLGQRIAACIVPKNAETTEQEILAACLRLLPRYKIPHEIRMFRQLPKNSSGKTDLPQLTNQMLNDDPSGTRGTG